MAGGSTKGGKHGGADGCADESDPLCHSVSGSYCPVSYRNGYSPNANGREAQTPICRDAPLFLASHMWYIVMVSSVPSSFSNSLKIAGFFSGNSPASNISIAK